MMNIRFATLRAGVDAFRKASSTHDRMASIYEANEGLLDRELATDDPVQAFLDRMLTPPTH